VLELILRAGRQRDGYDWLTVAATHSWARDEERRDFAGFRASLLVR
jgi:hypothetical protein